MEIFVKKTSDTWSIFEEELEAFCDEHHIIIRKEDCKLFNETDLIYKTFKYQFVKYECVHAGKPRENKKDNSRKDQSELDLIHIDSFQSLLASQFVDINGLCDPTIYSYGQYCDGIGRAVSIFINNPTKNHWATITNHMDRDTYVWQIYDSLNTSIDYFKPFFKSIIPNETTVEVRIMNRSKTIWYK